MSEQAVAHGWPDGEARAMPYGAVLAFLNGSTFPGGGTVTETDLAAGAWRSLALSIDTGGVAVDVAIAWAFNGDATVAPTSSTTHPGDGSVVRVPTAGHTITSLVLTAAAGTPLTYAIVGSNLVAGSSSGNGAALPATYKRPAAPAVGVEAYPLYTVPAGKAAQIQSIHAEWIGTTQLSAGKMTAFYLQVLDAASGRRERFVGFNSLSETVPWVVIIDAGFNATDPSAADVVWPTSFPGISTGPAITSTTTVLTGAFLPAGFVVSLRAISETGSPDPASQWSNGSLLVVEVDV